MGDARPQIEQLLSELEGDCSAGDRPTIFNNEFQHIHQELLRKPS